jgi:hypothetical protein
MARDAMSTLRHGLTPTGGRKLWIAGVPIETIAEIPGHASVEETTKDLGIKVSDMARAQQRLAEYETAQRLVHRRSERPLPPSQ